MKNNIEQLMNEVCDEINSRGNFAVINDVVKNNSTLKGFSVRINEEDIIAPTLYEDYFEAKLSEGFSVSEIADDLIGIAKEAVPSFDISRINDADFLLENAKLCVCNKNNNAEFLKDSVYEMVPGTDLCAYVKINLGDYCSARVTESLLESSNLTSEQIFTAAKENAKENYTVQSLAEVIGIPTAELDPSLIPPIVMISNTEHWHGASSIAVNEAMQQACEMLETDSILVIPASVHELLAVPMDIGPGAEEVSDLIQSINESDLEPQEILGNEPYLFSNGKLSMALCTRELCAERTR